MIIFKAEEKKAKEEIKFYLIALQECKDIETYQALAERVSKFNSIVVNPKKRLPEPPAYSYDDFKKDITKNNSRLWCWLNDVKHLTK